MFKRDWVTYMVKSVFADSESAPWPVRSQEELQKHKDDQLVDWQALVLHLPTPVLVSADVVDVVEVKLSGSRGRLYPPLQLNHQAELGAAFERTWLPEGALKVDRCLRIDDTAVKGVQSAPVFTQEVSFCQGMRIDGQNGLDVSKLLNSLLEHICQQTGQWWLRGRANPFKGAVQLGCEINKDFTLRELLRHAGPKQLESTWMGVDQRLALIGIEAPLTNQLWLRCCHDVNVGQKTDAGLIAFYDAINSYMCNEDEQCVLNLGIAIEIMANKNRLSKGKQVATFNKLLQQSELIDSKSKVILQKLYADRNHVAHGAPVQHLGQAGGPTIEDYLETANEFKKRYLASFSAGQWHKFSQLNISLPKK